MPSPLLFETEDGSHSLFSDQFQVSYHSKYGAVQETAHVFINAGLKYIQTSKNNISVLEMGFGTGLNALMTFIAAEENNLAITYHTIEAFPIPESLVKQLNYKQLFPKSIYQDAFTKMHKVTSNQPTVISPRFNFCISHTQLETFQTNERFDVIYFDAFAPTSQPELWTEAIFKKMYGYLNEGGVLVTYCAKGIVKRSLKSVGFEIDAIPGPPGKREMTRAIKK